MGVRENTGIMNYSKKKVLSHHFGEFHLDRTALEALWIRRVLGDGGGTPMWRHIMKPWTTGEFETTCANPLKLWGLDAWNDSRSFWFPATFRIGSQVIQSDTCCKAPSTISRWSSAPWEFAASNAWTISLCQVSGCHNSHAMPQDEIVFIIAPWYSQALRFTCKSFLRHPHVSMNIL